MKKEKKLFDEQSQFIDIIYSASQKGTLRIKNKEIIQEYPILPGSNNILCISLPKGHSLENYTIENPEDFLISQTLPRTDFFDFLQLSKKYPLENILANEDYKKTIQEISPSVIFFVTYRCTYKCPFCWQRNDAGKYANVHPQQFDPNLIAQIFNRLQPSSIYFTGGEPTLYKGLYSLIAKLDPRIKITMTSNLGPSFDTEQFIQLVKPEQCLPLGFSYHPSETTENQYLEKLDKLLAAGFPVYTESVLYGPDIPRLLEIKEKLAQRGVECRYDRCSLPDGQIHQLTQEQEALVKELVGYKEEIAANAEPAQENPRANRMENKQGLIICPAGYKNFHIDPLGDIYCCMSALDRSRLFSPYALPHYTPIGNIMDTEFTYLDRPIYCWEAFRCSACDYGRLQKAWYHLSQERPSLPE